MRKIAILNQKGGVGKTTTAVNLSAALAAAQRRVTILDLDPQAHATLHLGVEPGPTTVRFTRFSPTIRRWPKSANPSRKTYG